MADRLGPNGLVGIVGGGIGGVSGGGIAGGNAQNSLKQSHPVGGCAPISPPTAHIGGGGGDGGDGGRGGGGGRLRIFR